MSFEKDVLEKSNELPVVVDFWAPWCGPCQYLGPVIEQLASEAGGKWGLVKINTDENQELSLRYGIRGIPAVKMFSKGEVIAEFTGALPKHEILKWLDQHIPSEEKQLLEKIRKSLANSETGAISQLEKFVVDYPEVDEAKLLLAKELIWIDPDRAMVLTKEVNDRNKYFQIIEQLDAVAVLLKAEFHGPSPAQNKLAAAQEAFRSGDLESGIALLIEAVSLDKNYMDELPRKASVAFFSLMGPAHDYTKKFRKRFDMALY